MMTAEIEDVVQTAVLERDECYRAMRRVIPGLAMPADQRPPLTDAQAAAVAAFLAAERRLRALRSGSVAIIP